MKHLLKLFQPPPQINVSDWAGKYRYLSSEYSAYPGKYSTDRTPYAVEMMNCLNDDSVETITLMTGTQMGKSTVIENMIAYLVCNNPAPMLFMLPNHTIAESVSKDRIAPMVRDTPELAARFTAADKLHKTESTIKIKKFQGGQLTLVGSNSPSDLASRSIKYLFADEIDRNERGAGREGDAVSLAFKRTTNFADRKIILTSTPTIKNESRIEAAYEESDKRKYYVPCPHCKEKQIIVFASLKWEKSETGEHLPDTVYMECKLCQGKIYEKHKQDMLLNGEWIKEAPNVKGKAGFWISALYSPWVNWAKVVSEHIDISHSNDKERLKTFINTTFAETFEDRGEIVDDDKLLERQEDYNPNEQLPDGLLFLTASIDVQEHFLSVEVAGWGLDSERWGVERKVIIGSTKDPFAWEQLAKFLWDGYPKNIDPAKRKKPACVCVDSGFNTADVKAFCGKYGYKNVHAIKGMAGSRPLISKPKKGIGANVVLVGVDEAKDRILGNSLKLEKIGPNYWHFPKTNGYDFVYFKELVSEQKKTKFNNGFATRYWSKVSKSQPNEALDNAVYNLAALHILNPDWDAWKKKALKERELDKKEEPKALDKQIEEEKKPAKPSINREINELDRRFKIKRPNSWMGRI